MIPEHSNLASHSMVLNDAMNFQWTGRIGEETSYLHGTGNRMTLRALPEFNQLINFTVVIT